MQGGRKDGARARAVGSGWMMSDIERVSFRGACVGAFCRGAGSFATLSCMRRDVASPVAWQDEAMMRRCGDVQGRLGAKVGHTLGTNKAGHLARDDCMLRARRGHRWVSGHVLKVFAAVTAGDAVSNDRDLLGACTGPNLGAMDGCRSIISSERGRWGCLRMQGIVLVRYI